MLEDGFLRWGLTALLLAGSLYAAFHAARKSPPAARVGFGLHAAMTTAMALMLTPGLHWPALPQILLFGLAAWWFVLRAVARQPLPAGRHVLLPNPAQGRRAETAGRGTLLYNALTMAAMAYRLAAMDGPRGHGALAGSESAGLPFEAHHRGAVPVLLPPGSLADWGSQSALVLAVAFGLSGALWAFLLLRGLRPHGRRVSGDAFLELVGAGAMAVMFAALAAARPVGR